jgi:hypothetical protein
VSAQERADRIRDQRAAAVAESLAGLGARTGPETPCGHGVNEEGDTCGATPTRLYPGGVRCADHTPAAVAGREVPVPAPFVPSPPRPLVEYGRATSDPLGREGPGWHLGKQSKLPTRTKD